jgi:hypothetical protein
VLEAEVAALMQPASLVDLIDLVHRPEWMRDALCREHPEVNFFPAVGESAAAAKAVCADCLAYVDCHAYALAQGLTLAGVWAGMSARDRRRVLALHAA